MCIAPFLRSFAVAPAPGASAIPASFAQDYPVKHFKPR